MLFARDQLERIELGDEMAAGPVGADQEPRAERIARCGKRGLLGEGRRRNGRERRSVLLLQEGPRASARTSPAASPRLAKKLRHSGSTETGLS